MDFSATSSPTKTPTQKPTMPVRTYVDVDLAIFPQNYNQGFKLLGTTAGDNSGCFVASAGDINGDGYSDIIIGANGADPNSRINAGSSYVIFGKSSGFSDIDLASLSPSQGFKVLGAASGDSAGIVSSAGDINGDGYSDIIIGAWLADPNGRTERPLNWLC